VVSSRAPPAPGLWDDHLLGEDLLERALEPLLVDRRRRSERVRGEAVRERERGASRTSSGVSWSRPSSAASAFAHSRTAMSAR
jgi:hypothetical protein